MKRLFRIDRLGEEEKRRIIDKDMSRYLAWLNR